MNCEECTKEKGYVICKECDEVLCQDCDKSLHKGGTRKFHSRPLICSSCKSSAIIECKLCCIFSCESCKTSHSAHKTTPILISKTLGVFWDISNYSSLTKPINDVIKEISQRIAVPKFVKLYTDLWNKEQIDTNAEVFYNFEIPTLESLILDVYVKLNTGLNCVLIVSYDIFAISAKLLHLQTFGIQVYISRGVLPLKFYNLNRKFRGKIKNERRLSVGVRKIDKFLCFTGCEGVFRGVCETLVEFARVGRIFIEKSELADKVANKEKVTIDESSQFIKSAINKRIINEFSIEINNNAFNFLSLKPKNLSLEVLNWVLRYLKREEILSTYKNIKITLKRVFGLQVSKSEWKLLWFRLPGCTRSYSKSEKKQSFEFELGKSTVFPLGNKWKGLDWVKTDIFEIKAKGYWEDFLSFLERHFSINYKENIPLGRYGLAVLIKYSGPESLKILTTGKLLYLINQAITDNYLTYSHKNLVWSKDFKILNNLSFQKMQNTKKSLLHIISSYPNGVSLSQLPKIYLKKNRHALNVQEFGYKKLKEFLQSISEVEISPEGFTHLKRKPVFDRENLAEIISGIIKEKEFGVTESILQATLQARINDSIDWGVYNVSNCAEFIKAYSKQSIEILRTPEYNILFKANEFRSYSYFFPFKSKFHSAVLETSRVPTPHIYNPLSYSIDFSGVLPGNAYVPMQRIINVSNLPSDMIQKSPFRDSDTEDFHFDRFINEELYTRHADNEHFSKSVQISHQNSIFQLHDRTRSLRNVFLDQHHNINYSWSENKPLGLEDYTKLN